MPQKMARGLKFLIQEEEGLYYLRSENKALISLAVNVQLMCVFVFAYAKSRFSHDRAEFNEKRFVDFIPRKPIKSILSFQTPANQQKK